MKKRIDLKKYSSIIVLVAMLILFSMTNKNFLTYKNLYNIVNQNTYYIISGIGMTLLMIGGGVDLALGFELSLIGVTIGTLIVNLGFSVPAAIGIVILMGIALGSLNGFIVIKLKVLPLIATLATCSVYKGLSYTISDSKTIRSFPEVFQQISRGTLLGINYDIWGMLLIVIIASFVLYKTYYGRCIYAVGSNAEASRLAGIPTKLVQFSLYALCGMLASLASIDMVSKANAVTSSFGDGVEFTCVTAAVIGGVNFQGGEGTIWGAIVGVFIIQILQNGMQLAGWSTYMQYIIKGAILVLAVAFDEFQHYYNRKKELRMRENG